MDVLLAEPGPQGPAPAEPFRLGSFLVRGDGGLHPQGSPALRFAWRGRPCEARVAPGRVALSVAAGAVPYTAQQPAHRQAVLAEILQLPAALPDGWRLCVLTNHRLRLETERLLPEPASAAALVSAMVRFALDLDPYLDRLETVGVSA